MHWPGVFESLFLSLTLHSLDAMAADSRRHSQARQGSRSDDESWRCRHFRFARAPRWHRKPPKGSRCKSAVAPTLVSSLSPRFLHVFLWGNSRVSSNGDTLAVLWCFTHERPAGGGTRAIFNVSFRNVKANKGPMGYKVVCF